MRKSTNISIISDHILAITSEIRKSRITTIIAAIAGAIIIATINVGAIDIARKIIAIGSQIS